MLGRRARPGCKQTRDESPVTNGGYALLRDENMPPRLTMNPQLSLTKENRGPVEGGRVKVGRTEGLTGQSLPSAG